VAQLHLGTGAFDLAMEEAREVLKRDPKSIQARLIIGGVYLFKNDIPKATKSYEEVIQIAPNNPIGYFQMGRVLLTQKKAKEALPQFEKALSIQPNFLEALNLIVAIYLDQKRIKGRSTG